MLESHIMATRFAHEDAARLAGEVFGEILKREADPGGYAYVLDCLESGSKSLQQIVVEFIASDEFIDRFVALDNLASAANLVFALLLDRPLDGEAQLQSANRELIRVGLRGYAELIVASEEYQTRVGPDRVPTRAGRTAAEADTLVRPQNDD
jgi:hypothetical protein